MYVVARYRAQLGSLRLEEVSFISRDDVKLNLEGKKWTGKKIRAHVELGPLRLEKVNITPEMAARLDPSAAAISLGIS
jgi:hypothetical protein